MANSPKPIDFRRERGRRMIYIGVSALVAIGVWLAIAELAPAVPGMGTLAARMVFTLKCVGLAVLFCLVTGVEAGALVPELGSRPLAQLLATLAHHDDSAA